LGGRLEVNDGFARFRVVERGARDALDRLRILPQVAHGGVEKLLLLLFGFYLGLQNQDFFPHPFVELKDWKIPKENAEQTSEDYEPDDQMGQALPNSKINLLSQVEVLRANSGEASICIEGKSTRQNEMPEELGKPNWRGL
jgi:hypothetical protein